MNMQSIEVTNSNDTKITQIYHNWGRPILWILIVIILLLISYFLKKNYWDDSPFDLVINVHGNKGYFDNPLKDEGEVNLRLLNFEFQSSVRIQDGVAVFRSLPYQYLKEKVNFSINAKIYEVKNIDSVYTIAKNIDLEIKTKHLDCVWGHVSADGKYLEGVEVRVEDSIKLTDKDGKFRIYIPENRKPELELFAKKLGYTTYSGFPIFIATVSPSLLSDHGQQIILIKINKK